MLQPLQRLLSFSAKKLINPVFCVFKTKENNKMKVYPNGLIIFDAIVRAKLTYGLETTHLIDSALKKLDTFQLKVFRKS